MQRNWDQLIGKGLVGASIALLGICGVLLIVAGCGSLSLPVSFSAIILGLLMLLFAAVGTFCWIRRPPKAWKMASQTALGTSEASRRRSRPQWQADIRL